MHGEYLFHAHAIGDTADGEGFVDAAVLLGDDSAFEDLDTLFCAFLDLDVDADGVADADDGCFCLDVLVIQNFDQIGFHGCSSCFL